MKWKRDKEEDERKKSRQKGPRRKNEQHMKRVPVLKVCEILMQLTYICTYMDTPLTMHCEQSGGRTFSLHIQTPVSSQPSDPLDSQSQAEHYQRSNSSELCTTVAKKTKICEKSIHMCHAPFLHTPSFL